MSDPWSFKLPLTAKSVTVLLFCCFCSSYAIVTLWAAEPEGCFLDQDPAWAVRSGWRDFSDNPWEPPNRPAGSAARARTHSLPPSSLNRPDLLSWVDMGKLGTGFSGICHRLFNDINAFLPFQYTLTHVVFLFFFLCFSYGSNEPIQIASCDRPTSTR